MRTLALWLGITFLAACPAWAEEPEAPTTPPVDRSVPPATTAETSPEPAPAGVVVERAPVPWRPSATAIPCSTESTFACDIPCAARRNACGWDIDEDGFPKGRIEIALEGSASWLPSPDGLLGPLAIGGLAPQFDWGDLSYDVTGGGRVAVRYAVAPQQWIEARGVWYGTWSDDQTRRGVFGLRPGLGGPGDPLASRPAIGHLSTEARAWGAELNFQTEVTCRGKARIDVLVGGRAFKFEEDARADLAAGTSPNFPGPAFADAEATTWFAGLQVGAVVHWDATPHLEFLGTLKAFGGWTRQEADVHDRSIFAGGFHGSSTSDDDLDWGAEVEVGFRWRIRRHVSITGGYDLFLLDSVQRGPDALDLTQSTSGAVQAGLQEDGLFIQSLFLGLTLDF